MNPAPFEHHLGTHGTRKQLRFIPSSAPGWSAKAINIVLLYPISAPD